MNSLRPPLSTRGFTLKNTWHALVLIVVGSALVAGYALAHHEKQAQHVQAR